MFKKPFRMKSQTIMKGSDRKKLRAEMSRAFGGLSQDTLVEILPNKEEVTVTKLFSHAGDTVIVYCVNKQPLLFEIDKEKVLYPTVYLLWRHPDLITRFTTWPPVFNKLADGADLMLPGLVVRETVTPYTFRDVEKGQTCSINVVGNKAPLVLGYTLLSGSDFYDSGMKGKGVRPLHMYGDELWSFGDKSKPPDMGDEPLPEEYLEDGSEGENGAEAEDSSAGSVGADGVEGPGSVAGMVDGIDDLTLAQNSTQEDGATEDIAQGEENQDTNMTQDKVDELVQFCFLCAVKDSVKKADLPLATASLYRSHMMKYCPSGCVLDIKKSSWKKLSKFLQHQQEMGIIQMKQLSKGVDSVTDVDRSHDMLRGLDVPDVPQIASSAESGDGKVVPPQIMELYAINANTLALFQGLGYRKGDSLTSQDVRKCITEYIKNNNLQTENAKNHVTLDPLLAEVVLNKSEGDRGTLTWDAVFSRLLNKMSPVCEITIAGKAPYIRKGRIESITLDVTQKASNKKVTVVENLDSFGIDPKEFGHVVQVKMACSASVSPSQQKNKGPVVLVQGNQITFVAELLTNTYQIPKKYIKGLEKAPKSKRR